MTYREGLSRPLTMQEVDTNFRDLDESVNRIDTLFSNSAQVNKFENYSSTGIFDVPVDSIIFIGNGANQNVEMLYKISNIGLSQGSTIQDFIQSPSVRSFSNSSDMGQF